MQTPFSQTVMGAIIIAVISGIIVILIQNNFLQVPNVPAPMTAPAAPQTVQPAPSAAPEAVVPQKSQEQIISEIVCPQLTGEQCLNRGGCRWSSASSDEYMADGWCEASP